MKSLYSPRPQKNYRHRAAALEKKIRTAATRICLENGVEEHSVPTNPNLKESP
jgi:hypothetical protein